MKVIFLDIDGVIQPTWKQKRFEHLDEMDEMAKRLDAQIPGYEYYRYVTVEKYPGCVFTAYSRKCSLAAVCFDWDKDAVEYLRQVLEQHDAKIVISSDWRDGGEFTMKSFLAIYGLDKYFYDMLEGLSYRPPTERQARAQKYFGSVRKENQRYDERAADIRNYLDLHKEVTAYVAVDDRNLGFPVAGHFVHCSRGIIRQEEFLQMKELIEIEDGPYPINYPSTDEEAV